MCSWTPSLTYARADSAQRRGLGALDGRRSLNMRGTCVWCSSLSLGGELRDGDGHAAPNGNAGVPLAGAVTPVAVRSLVEGRETPRPRRLCSLPLTQGRRSTRPHVAHANRVPELCMRPHAANARRSSGVGGPAFSPAAPQARRPLRLTLSPTHHGPFDNLGHDELTAWKAGNSRLTDEELRGQRGGDESLLK